MFPCDFSVGPLTDDATDRMLVETTAREDFGGRHDSTPLGENALIFTLFSATKGITIITQEGAEEESEGLWLCRPLRMLHGLNTRGLAKE